MIFWFNAEGTGYFEGPTEEQQLYWPDAIIVSQSPGREYAYNFSSSSWEKTELSVREAWQAQRNNDLMATAWLIGSDSPLTTEQEISLRQWRLSCEGMFEQPPEDVQAPVCPDYVLPWIDV